MSSCAALGVSSSGSVLRMVSQVLHTARHSETEEIFVVYRCLYGEYGVWVRPIDMFTETVMVEGSSVPRFKLIKALTD